MGAIAAARLIPASFANVPKAGVPERSGDGRAHVVARPLAVRDGHRAPCSGCGVIESMRQSERSGTLQWQGMIEAKTSRGDSSSAAGAVTPAHAATEKHYEFTVRFRDGSTTVFSETSPRAWRLGSRVMVIGDVGSTSR